MRILFLNFYEGPENFHFEQAFIRNANKLKNCRLDIIHNFKEDLSPLATAVNEKGFRKNFGEISENKIENYDAVFSLDFPWKKDKSCSLWLKALSKGKKKIFIANHLLPEDEHAPFFVWLKEKNIFSIFDSAYFYAFDHPSNFPRLKKGAVKYRTYYIDSVYYSPDKTKKDSDFITVFLAGSKERAFQFINPCLRENPQIKIKMISNSDFKPAKKYSGRFKLLKFNENIFRIKEEISSSDLVLIPINDKSKNQTAGMAVAFMGMSMAKPVIAKSRLWMRDYIEHEKNGFLYLASSKIPQAVKNAVKLRRKWDLIGKEARKTILKKAALDSFAAKLVKEAFK